MTVHMQLTEQAMEEFLAHSFPQSMLPDPKNGHLLPGEGPQNGEAPR